MRNEKQCLILDSALKVFTRFGLKKTSIDDIAKAADISRQGVYLHFKNKEEIFRASLEKYFDDQHIAAHAILNSDLSLEAKLLDSLQECFGKNVGLLHPEANDVIQEGSELVKPLYTKFGKEFRSAVAKVVQKQGQAERKVAEDISELLWACSVTWKHELDSPQSFQKRMRSTLKIVLSGLGGSLG